MIGFILGGLAIYGVAYLHGKRRAEKDYTKVLMLARGTFKHFGHCTRCMNYVEIVESQMQVASEEERKELIAKLRRPRKLLLKAQEAERKKESNE